MVKKKKRQKKNLFKGERSLARLLWADNKATDHLLLKKVSELLNFNLKTLPAFVTC